MQYGGSVSLFYRLWQSNRVLFACRFNKIGSINKINKTFAFLEQAHERMPSAEEIARELDMTVEDVKQSLKNSGRHVSMDAPLIDGEDSNLYDVLSEVENLQILTRIFYTNL